MWKVVLSDDSALWASKVITAANGNLDVDHNNHQAEIHFTKAKDAATREPKSPMKDLFATELPTMVKKRLDGKLCTSFHILQKQHSIILVQRF